MDGTLIIIIDDRRSPWMKPMTMAKSTKPIVIFNSGGWIGSASLTFIAPRNNNICKKNQIAGRWFDIIIRNAQVNRAKKIAKMVLNNNPMWMSGYKYLTHKKEVIICSIPHEMSVSLLSNFFIIHASLVRRLIAMFIIHYISLAWTHISRPECHWVKLINKI